VGAPTSPLSLGLFTDAVAELSTADMFAWVKAHRLDTVELGTGGNSASPHIALEDMLTERGRRTLLRHVDTSGVQISAFNCSGNPLFPDPFSQINEDDRTLRDTLIAAAELGVPRVVCMSGCPSAGPQDDTRAAFVPATWHHPADTDLVAWQWDEVLLPYWQDLLTFAAEVAPSVLVCLELDPGYLVFSPRTFYRLVTDLKKSAHQLRVNLDPSHLFWQGMDPCVVAKNLGSFIAHVHAKDTIINSDSVLQNGWLDRSDSAQPGADGPFRYATVGDGHNATWWTQFCRTLLTIGYTGTLSIEWEDEEMTADRSVVRSAQLLRAAIDSAVERHDHL
jgi:sugar phosphate isomerase/epimerase